MTAVKRTALGTACLLFTCGLWACSATPTTSPDPYAEKIAQSLQKLEEHFPADEPGCSVAVGIDGTVVWAAQRGLADLGKGTPLTATSTFETGYITHQFVAAVALPSGRRGQAQSRHSCE
jgi:CubicO group peptidase (beta-lactamase class C family)